MTAAGLPRDLLVFALDGADYAVDAALVRRTLWLPELAPAPEAAPGTVGRFNLGGEVVPVADLAACLGQGWHRPRAGDQVIVLDLEDGPLGIIAGEVRDLVGLDPGQVLQEEAPDQLVAGTLQLQDALATLLDIRHLARHAIPGNPAPGTRDLDPEELARLQARARTLREEAAGEESGDVPLAVVALGGQYLGIGLEAVQEFRPVPQVLPLPCCPPHIAGVFNLRGHLLTLLEISSAFDLPPPPGPRSQAVIARLDGGTVGVAVDEVVDVFKPRAADLKPAPEALVQRHGVEIQALAAYAGHRVLVVDLPALLALERWTVDET